MIKNIITALLLIPLVSSAGVTTFGNALSAGYIRYEVKCHPDEDRRMQIALNNTTRQPLDVEVETGRTFYAASGNVQPFVVTRMAVVHLEAKEQRVVWFHARCGNSSARAPGEKTRFESTEMGAPEMVAMLQKINEQRITDDQLYQTVVWHFTNNHPASSVYSSRVDPAVLDEIRNSISQREIVPSNWYISNYKPAAGGNDMEFSGQLESIQATLPMKTQEGENICIVLKDEEGNIAAVLGYYINVPAGENDYTIRIPGDGLAKGRYTVQALSKSQRLILERELVI
ncbi:MAG: hypothetical protein U0Y08_15270 [Bacteroidia bacterium]